jgi:hypothetical protein
MDVTAKDSPETLFKHEEWRPRDEGDVLLDVAKLREMHRTGQLGGERMPEDAAPRLDLRSADLFHYFTLGMSLNYQRNSYRLWEAATKTFEDSETQWVFSPRDVIARSHELREALARYKLALQPTRHTDIWLKLCEAIDELYAGDIRRLFRDAEGKVDVILEHIQVRHKKRFPYLSGAKICNYWLYVMESYTDVVLRNRHLLSVAPDTHVMQSTKRLGLVDPRLPKDSTGQQVVADAWRRVLRNTGLEPIDVHTPLWLWSKAGFPGFC